MRACGHWCQSAALIYRKISKECVRFHGYFTGYFPAFASPSRKCTIRASNGARSGSETESLLFNQYFLFALFHILRNAIPMLLWMNFSVIRTYWDWLHTEKCFVLWYLRLLPLAENFSVGFRLFGYHNNSLLPPFFHIHQRKRGVEHFCYAAHKTNDA